MPIAKYVESSYIDIVPEPEGCNVLFALVAHGSSLVSRGRGAHIRELVLSEASDDQIVLDFAGVTRASYSFVDELVGKLCSLSADGDLGHQPKVVNANEVIEFHVGQCLDRRLATPV